MLKNCKFCSKQFEASHFNQGMCSDDCRMSGRRISKSKYKMTEKGVAATKRWQSSDRFKENEKKYRQKPKAKALAVDRAARYIKSNPAAYERRLRSMSLAQKAKRHSLKDWWMKESSKGCRNCGSILALTIDHIIPMSKGGRDDLSNLQCLCKSCNSSKGNRL